MIGKYYIKEKVNNTYLSERTEPLIIAMGSGKGGVGKSFLASNLSICLAKQGFKVCLLDLDLGGANIHTYLGGVNEAQCLSDFFSGRVNSLKDIIIKSKLSPNLSFISGSNDSYDVASVSQSQHKRLQKDLRNIDADIIFLDLGAGTANYTLDYFLTADKSLVTYTPEPTSIENLYRFLKSAFYRKLKKVEKDSGIKQLIDTAMDNKNELGIKSPNDLLSHIQKLNEDSCKEFSQKIKELEFNFILNQVRTGSDINLGKSICSVSHRYLGTKSNFLGYISYDNAVWQSIRRKKSILTDTPHLYINSQILEISKQLVGESLKKAVV